VRVPQTANIDGKTLKEMADITSKTAMAPRHSRIAGAVAAVGAVAYTASAFVPQTGARAPASYQQIAQGAVNTPATVRAPAQRSTASIIAGAGLMAAAAAAQRRTARQQQQSKTLSFQQQEMKYPSALEQIADTNPPEGEKKTNIICTIGPKSWDPEVLVKLIDAGFNIMRCNMSHGDHEEQSMKMDNLKKAYEMRPDLEGKVQVLMDTRGPEIRTGKFAVYNSKKELKAGQDFRLVCDDYETLGDETKVAITYSKLPGAVKPGQRILIQDGTVILDVVEAGEGYVDCKVVNDCKLGEKKNCNVPGVKVDIPVVDEREIFDIEKWAVPNDADYIALSFVQCPEDVIECRKHCAGKPIKIISKIENVEGLKNFEAILEESDGIMVARGDLGMEIPMEKIFMAQKMMLQKTREEDGSHVTLKLCCLTQKKDVLIVNNVEFLACFLISVLELVHSL